MSALLLSADAPGALDEAVARLRADELVVFPTDTVYGVGAHGLREEAVAKLFTAKFRPLHKAIPLLLADAADVAEVAQDVSDVARDLMARYWPGALTLVVAARPGLPPSLTAGEPTVAVRMPDCEVTRALARLLGAPLAATSANLSGASPAVTAQEAVAALGDRVALVLDGGPSPIGQASTVLDVTVYPPRVLRAGHLVDDAYLASLLASPS